MSATTHEIKTARPGNGRPKKIKYRVGAQNLLWQGFLNFRSYVFEEVDPSETKLKVDHPDLFAKLEFLEKRIISEPKGDLAIIKDIRGWMDAMVKIVAQREK